MLPADATVLGPASDGEPPSADLVDSVFGSSDDDELTHQLR